MIIKYLAAFCFIILISANCLYSQVNNKKKNSDDYSFLSLKKYIGQYPCINNDFLKNKLIRKELKKILEDDFKNYIDFLSCCGCGQIEYRDGILVSDNSQLHVGGYSSIILFDIQNKKTYLFWLNSRVIEKQINIYGNKPVPETIKKIIVKNMNESWGHVARFSFIGDSLVTDLGSK